MSLNPTQKQRVRAIQRGYCLQAIANEPRIHYTQARPFHYYDDIGARWVELDCSGFVGNVWWNCLHDYNHRWPKSPIWLADPLNFKYTGIGNTSSLEWWLRQHGKRIDPDTQPLLIGDMARWGTGDHAHTAIVHQKGTRRSALLTSHGREGGPNPVNLDYRSDLIGVWRHPALV